MEEHCVPFRGDAHQGNDRRFDYESTKGGLVTPRVPEDASSPETFIRFPQGPGIVLYPTSEAAEVLEFSVFASSFF